MAVRDVKIREPVGVDAEMFGGQQAPVSDGLSDGAVFLPSPCADVQRSRQQGQSTVLTQRFHQPHVFHQSNFREPAESFEDFASKEDSLISVRDTGGADSQRVARFHEPKQQSFRVDPMLKRSARNFWRRQRSLDLLSCLRNQPRVGVKEKQNVTSGNCRSSILLDGSPAPAFDHSTVEPPCNGDGVVGAASVGNDDLVRRQSQRRFNRSFDRVSFVQGRNDDGQFHRIFAQVG